MVVQGGRSGVPGRGGGWAVQVGVLPGAGLWGWPVLLQMGRNRTPLN